MFAGFDENLFLTDQIEAPTPRVLATQFDFADEYAKPTCDGISTRQKRKYRILTLDTSIELSSTELKSWQSDYLDNMKRQKLSRRSKADKAIIESNANLCTWNFRGEVKNPSLEALFCGIPSRRSIDRTEREVPAHPETLGEMLSPVLELALRQSSVDVELGRRAPTEESDTQLRRPSILPWNLSREGSAARSLSAQGPAGGMSSVNTPRQFSFMQTPVIGPRQPSLRPASQRSASLAFKGLERLDSLDPPLTLSESAQMPPVESYAEAHGVEAAFDTQAANDTSFILQNMEQEALNFLECDTMLG